MVASEWAAFEVTSLAASYLGTAQLASQSIPLTTASLMFQAPFAVSVAASSRVGNLIGAGLREPARKACYCVLALGFTLALIGL